MTNRNAELPRDYDPTFDRCYFPTNNMQADWDFGGYFGHLDPLLGWEDAAPKADRGVNMTFTRSVTERVRPTALLFVHEMFARVPYHPNNGRDVAVWAIDRPISKYENGDVKRTTWKPEITPGLGKDKNMGGIVLPKYPRGLDQNSPDDMSWCTVAGHTWDKAPVFRMDASDWFVWLMAHNFYRMLPNITSSRTTNGNASDAGIVKATHKFDKLRAENTGSGDNIAENRKSAINRHSYCTKGEKWLGDKYWNSIVPGLTNKYGEPTELTPARKAAMFLDVEKRLAVQSKYLPSAWVQEYQKVEYPDAARHTHLLMLKELAKNT
jgi:hypothetical protein